MRDRADLPMRVAAGLAWLCGLGFGIPGAYGAWYFAEHDESWTFLGFPTNEAGPLFEGVGLDTSVPLLVAFTALCAVEVVLGVLLWLRRRSGAVLSLALLPLEFAFWIGLVLPVGPVAGIARTVLVLRSWPSRERPDVRPA
jgi:hypothetical protein